MATLDELIAQKLATDSKLQEAVAKAAGYISPSTATTGLQIYDLEAPAKNLFPILTPLRNIIPREKGKGGIQANWRAITGININRLNPGVEEGKRNGAVEHSVTEYYAAYRSLGLEDYVTFEADYAAMSFQDVKATAARNLLQSTMIMEEQIDLGGNATLALGTCSTPTLVSNATGGSIAQTTAVQVYCVALTLDGYQQVAGFNNGTTGQSVDLSTAALVSTITRTNMDGTTTTYNAGTSQKSALASVTTQTDGLSTHSISASVTPVRGAVAYAWYWGIAGGNVLLGAVTTINSVLITTTATGTQNITGLFTSDCSTNTLVYDGLLTQIMKSGSGAYFVDLPTGTAGTGTALTSDGAGGCTQVDTALASFWNLYRLTPNRMWMSANTFLSLSKQIIANNGAPLIRYANAGTSRELTAGNAITQYWNKITSKPIIIEDPHPNMPDGMIMFWSDTIPYPLSGVRNTVLKRCRRDYYSLEWPLKTRRYEYGVYFDGVLQCYFPPAFGILRNIAV